MGRKRKRESESEIERERGRARERERATARGGPRLRVTTVRKCAALTAAGGLVRLQLPRTLPARPGKDLSPSSPWEGHEKIRNGAHRRRSASIVTDRARLNAELGPLGGRSLPTRLVLPAALAAPRVGSPGPLRASLARTPEAREERSPARGRRLPGGGSVELPGTAGEHHEAGCVPIPHSKTDMRASGA